MVFHALVRLLERVTVGVISGLRPGSDPADIARWLAGCLRPRRYAIIAVVIGGLFATSLLFAQWGWLGIAVYLALVVWLVA